VAETRIEVFGRRNSVNVQKVMWTLGELDLPYDRHDVSGSFGIPPDYLQLNPNPIVPTIRDGDFVLWESNACVRYLCHHHGSDNGATVGLWPQDPQTLALADQWMEWQRSDVMQYFFQVFLNLVRLPPAKAKPELVAPGAQGLARLYQQLDDRLAQQPYVAGEHFTMGDIPVGAMTYRYLSLAIERPDLPHVQRWYQALTQRPAYAKHVMIPYGGNSDEWNALEQANAGVQ